MRHCRPLFQSVALIFCLCLSVYACSFGGYELDQPPDYDYMVGRKFSEAIYLGRRGWTVIPKTDALEELENRRSDGCILVFGVRKKDDIIMYWRVDSGIGSCYTRRKPLTI
jgi:hypothetical protein